MLKSRISKWNDLAVDAKGVALVLLEISKGSITELISGSHHAEDGIWGKASLELFGENLHGHRFWLFATFRENRRKVQTLYKELRDTDIVSDSNDDTNSRNSVSNETEAQVQNPSLLRRVATAILKPLSKHVRRKRGRSSNHASLSGSDDNESSNGSNTKEIYCWCKLRHFSTDQLDYVQCDRCDQWCHLLCTDLTLESAKKLERFVCPACTGQLKIPPMLRLTCTTEQTYIVTRFRTESLNKDHTRNNTSENAFIDISEYVSDTESGSGGHHASTSRIKNDGRYHEAVYDGDSKNGGSDEEHANNVYTDFERDGEEHIHPVDEDIFAHYEQNQFNVEYDMYEDDEENKYNVDTELEGSEDNKSSASSVSNQDKLDEEVDALDSNVVSEDEADEGIADVEGLRFCVFIEEQDWVQNYRPAKEYPHRLLTGWTDEIYEKYHQKKGRCMLTFDKHNLKRDSKYAAYFRGYAGCTFSDCPAKYTFVIREKPRAGQVTVEVTRTGEIIHKPGEKRCRQLARKRRLAAKEELKHMLPSVYRRKQFGLATSKELEEGNWNLPKTLNVFKESNAKRELDAEGDFSKDIIEDLVRTCKAQRHDVIWKSSLMPGYIQFILAEPTICIMFSEKQFRLLYKLNQWHKSVGSKAVVMLDATGSLVKREKKQISDPSKDFYYYSLVVKNPTAKEPPVAIAEMVSTDQTQETIAFFILMFFQKYKKMMGIQDKYFGIGHFEMDFSKAMLSAVVSQFACCNVLEYINAIWTKMVHPNDRDIFPVHVCRVHLLRFFSKQIRKSYAGNTSRLKNSLDLFCNSWIYGWLGCRNMNSIYRRMTDILVITGSVFLTPEVGEAIRNMKSRTIKLEDEPWTIIPVRIDASTFWERSLFGNCARSIANGVWRKSEEIKNEQKSADADKLEVNEYYNEELFTYMLIHFFPYSPLLCNAIFEVTGAEGSEDNTNPIEYWYNILKNYEYGKKLRLIFGRFVRRQAELLPGRLNQFEATMPKMVSGSEKVDAKKFVANRGLSKMEKLFREVYGIDSLKDPFETSGTKPSPRPKTRAATKNNLDEDKGKNRQANKIPTRVDGIKVNVKSNATFKEPQNYMKVDPSMGASTEDSPDRKDEKWGPKKDMGFARARNETILSTMYLIPWSGYVNIAEQRVRITNTCTIDNHMQILYAMYLFQPLAKRFLTERGNNSEVGKVLHEILQDLTREDISSAREKWVETLFVNGVNISVKRNVLDMYGSDLMMFLDHIADWFIVEQVDDCFIENCPFSKTTLTTPIGIEPHYTCEEFLNIVNIGRPQKCRRCKGDSTRRYSWGNAGPPSVFFYVNYSPSTGNSSIINQRNGIPKTQHIMGALYDVYAVVYFSPARKHYFTVFYHDGLELVYDGMRTTGGLTRVRNEPNDCYPLSIWLILQ